VKKVVLKRNPCRELRHSGTLPVSGMIGRQIGRARVHHVDGPAFDLGSVEGFDDLLGVFWALEGEKGKALYFAIPRVGRDSAFLDGSGLGNKFLETRC